MVDCVQNVSGQVKRPAALRVRGANGNPVTKHNGAEEDKITASATDGATETIAEGNSWDAWLATVESQAGSEAWTSWELNNCKRTAWRYFGMKIRSNGTLVSCCRSAAASLAINWCTGRIKPVRGAIEDQSSWSLLRRCGSKPLTRCAYALDCVSTIDEVVAMA